MDYKIYYNTHCMLKNRGYNIDLSKLSKDTITDTIIAKAPSAPPAPQDNLKDIIVFFPTEEKLGVKIIRNYYEDMKRLQITKAIIVAHDTVTSFGKSEILGLCSNEDYPVNIEIFTDNLLKFDITTHELVPKHELLNDQETKVILEKYKKNNLPCIKLSDPICRYYDFQLGSVIKITRPSETSGVYTNYRLVVN